jgi:hypothetical protein
VSLSTPPARSSEEARPVSRTIARRVRGIRLALPARIAIGRHIAIVGEEVGRAWRLAHPREAGTMSQKTVQLVIARLLTDEEVRLQFLGDPLGTLTAFRDQGFEMTKDEIDALLETDRELWTSAAARIHPRLQRCSFR